MELDIDESKLLYGLGAFLGIVAIIYFGYELILDLSPTIKSFILLSGAAVFIGAAEYVRQGLMKSSFYIFASFSYLSFLMYTFVRFSFSSEQIFLILALSSAVFIGLGYLRSEKGFNLTKNQAKKVVAVILVAVSVLVVIDVLGPQPEYSLELDDSVEVVKGGEVKIGELVVKNDFLFSRNLETPSFRGCMFIQEGFDGRNIYINPDTPGIISGSSEKRISLREEVHLRFSEEDRNITVKGNYTVVNSECPDEPEEKTIYIREGEENGVISSVVRD